MTVLPEPTGNEISTFVDFLYDGLQGYAFLGAKKPSSKEWLQEFFEWPAQRDKLISTIENVYKKVEVYLAPAIYARPHAEKYDVKETNVIWTEFDGNAPTEASWNEFGGPPSLVIRSSGEGHSHVYWRLSEPLSGTERIENITSRVAAHFGADPSVVNVNKVLRPPSTLS